MLSHQLISSPGQRQFLLTSKKTSTMLRRSCPDSRTGGGHTLSPTTTLTSLFVCPSCWTPSSGISCWCGTRLKWAGIHRDAEARPNPLSCSLFVCFFVSQDVGAEFENFPWFEAVETFCHGHGHEELEDTDRQTLSSVIEKTLLPKMTSKYYTLLPLTNISTSFQRELMFVWSSCLAVKFKIKLNLSLMRGLSLYYYFNHALRRLASEIFIFQRPASKQICFILPQFPYV